MKKKILLVDDSLTVQKVVALTLDRNRYDVSYAKSSPEAMKRLVEWLPDLVLVSDRAPEVSAASFPREMETWLARRGPVPPAVLITADDVRENPQYASVLRKPFAPAALQALVTRLLPQVPTSASTAAADDADDERLQKKFNDSFPDEARLVRETLAPELPSDPPPARASGGNDLWGGGAATAAPPRRESSAVMGANDSMAFKAALESEVMNTLDGRDLDGAVERALERLLPRIVEKLVSERLDRLLKEQENFVDVKA